MKNFINKTMPFQFSQKKIIIIIASVVVAIAVVFGVYFAWQKSKEILAPPISMEEGGRFEAGGPAIPAKKKLTIISDQPVFAYWTVGGSAVLINDQISGSIKLATSTAATSTIKSAATSTKIIVTSTIAAKPLEKQILYFTPNGKIYKANDKEDELVSDREIVDIQAVKPSRDGVLVVVKYGSKNSPSFEIFNAGTKIWQMLENVSATDFSPDGKQIAYLEKIQNSSANNLVIKDLFGTKPKTTKLLSFNQKSFDLKWISADKILLISSPSYQIQSEIWAFDIKKKTLSQFTKDYGLMFSWAKDNSFGLKFGVDFKGNNGKLNLIDENGAVKANLGFSTFADKCFVSVTKIYCAIPQSYTGMNFQKPKLPDEYLKRAAYSIDSIYEIDIEKNSFSGLFNEPQPVLDAIDFSLFDGQLLFVNRYDNKIYGLTL